MPTENAALRNRFDAWWDDAPFLADIYVMDIAWQAWQASQPTPSLLDEVAREIADAQKYTAFGQVVAKFLDESEVLAILQRHLGGK